MKKISVNIPTETLSQIEWLKVFYRETTPIKFTTTDIIVVAIDTVYNFIKSNKMDTKSK